GPAARRAADVRGAAGGTASLYGQPVRRGAGRTAVAAAAGSGGAALPRGPQRCGGIGRQPAARAGDAADARRLARSAGGVGSAVGVMWRREFARRTSTCWRFLGAFAPWREVPEDISRQGAKAPRNQARGWQQSKESFFHVKPFDAALKKLIEAYPAGGEPDSPLPRSKVHEYSG